MKITEDRLAVARAVYDRFLGRDDWALSESDERILCDIIAAIPEPEPLPAPTGPVSERAAFEAWMLNDEKWIVGSRDPYTKHGEEDRWRCWQAAWKAASVPKPDVQALRGQIESEVWEARKRVEAALAAEIVELRAQIAAARAEEREACARVVEHWALIRPRGCCDETRNTILADAADDIRARSGARG